MSPDRLPSTNAPISRRSALRTGVAAGAAGVSLTASAAHPVSAAQDATPTGMRSEHLEVDVVVSNPVNITRAGSGPPQRGDFFYIDGPIYATGDAGGAQIGQYNCFGAWTTAADDTSAPYQRLTTVQFQFDDGSIMGIVNEGGTGPSLGAVNGGTERYAGALGTFEQIVMQGVTPGTEAEATPGAMAATPAAPAGTLVHAVFDLILPAQG